jgi:BirA family biotin operon repressor/biotin-[acetyl-CoA-carboxylase] ligase
MNPARDLPVEAPAEIAEAWARASSRLGPFAMRLRCYASVGSTNDLALGLAEAGAEEGTTVVAETQTAGRGRRGREWFSPVGSGLYVSVLLRPGARGRQPVDWTTARLTLTAGVALAEGVRTSTALPVELKWPNDLVCGRRKLAGILAEMSGGRREEPAVVLGIGINVRTSAYPPALAAQTTSLEAELGRPIDRGLVLVETLAALAARYEDLREGRFGAILSAWRGHARSLAGAAIEWDGPQGVVQGLAMDVDADGALLARSGDAVTRLVAGEVRWRQ